MSTQTPGERTSGSAEGQGFRLGVSIASLIQIGLFITFMIQNTDDVTLDFLWWSFSWPLWLITLVSAVVGALVWIGLGVMRRHRRRLARREGRWD